MPLLSPTYAEELESLPRLEIELNAQNLSTVDRQPTFDVVLADPPVVGAVVKLFLDAAELTLNSDFFVTELSSTHFTVTTNGGLELPPGSNTILIEVEVDGLVVHSSGPISIDIVEIEHAWSEFANSDGPYTVGNSGSYIDVDPNVTDAFWIAVVGNIKPTDIVVWSTEWTPDSDGFASAPRETVYAPDGNSPWRLKVEPRPSINGAVPGGYASGVFRAKLIVNGFLYSGDLELQVGDNNNDGSPETITWSPLLAV